MKSLVDEKLHAQEFACTFAHLSSAFNEEVVVHPEVGTAMVRTGACLVLCNLVRMVNFAMVDAASVDVEWKSEQVT